MTESPLRLIVRSAEFIPKADLRHLPRRLRGIYVLYLENEETAKFDVQYVGMATAGRRGGIRGRLVAHEKSKRNRELWTHFSVFQVWDNIREEEIAELEGLFRHIYRHDSAANRLNIQRGFKKARLVRQDDIKNWPRDGSVVPRIRRKRPSKKAARAAKT
jgi:hypothetical protein